jgi:hypothetical protein
VQMCKKKTYRVNWTDRLLQTSDVQRVIPIK